MHDVVLILRTSQAVETLKRPRVTLGSHISVSRGFYLAFDYISSSTLMLHARVAGPIGAEADLDVIMDTSVAYYYVRNRVRLFLRLGRFRMG